MCGIAGELRLDGSTANPELTTAMIGTLVHRGPDDQGIYRNGPIALAHRRLSIIDLSDGAQPMSNAAGTLWVVFNGEIYNHEHWRCRLSADGYRFQNQSDTEVILALYEIYELSFVEHLTGMFSFALWDSQRDRLVIARDRIGIKPLYYTETSSSLIFASEIKALQVHPDFKSTLNAKRVDRFLTHYYPTGSETLISQVSKLKPGHMLIAENGETEERRYWRLSVGRNVRSLTLPQATAELEELLGTVVADHLIGDVPLGFLLSGGLDSSLIVALATKHLNMAPKTFTVGFDGSDVVDERPYARQIADIFQSEHYEITVRPENFWSFLPTYVRHMEEPVCEAPAIALASVSRLAAQHVKVILSGEGGDEAFAGYNNYRHQLKLQALSQRLHPLSRILGPPLAKLLTALGRDGWSHYASGLGTPLKVRYRSRTSSPHHWFARHRDRLYQSHHQSSMAEDTFDPELDALRHAEGTSTLSRMLQVDTETWLPDDLLVKADKMTMLESVELRVPLLDHRVLEWAARVPDELKLNGSSTKHVLRNLAENLLPEEIINRPKAGFPIPYERWLRTNLSDQVEVLLTGPDARSMSLFNRNMVLELLRADKRFERLGKEVFALVVLELWLREFVSE